MPGTSPRLAIVIPALDEERALPHVLAEIPAGLGARVIVVDNGSRDRTAEVARAGGAEVVHQPRRGYGYACQAGLEALAGAPPDIVVFLDADHSDYAEEMARLVEPIATGSADLVVGSRLRGQRRPGALPVHALWGNRFAAWMLRLLTGAPFTDLGPFRAIRWSALADLGMREMTFGWTAEMQVRAARRGLRCVEVPVSYRPRIGASKISGTFIGSVRAGAHILWTVFRAAAPGARVTPKRGRA